jgi:hypothetical protein
MKCRTHAPQDLRGHVGNQRDLCGELRDGQLTWLVQPSLGAGGSGDTAESKTNTRLCPYFALVKNSSADFHLHAHAFGRDVARLLLWQVSMHRTKIPDWEARARLTTKPVGESFSGERNQFLFERGPFSGEPKVLLLTDRTNDFVQDHCKRRTTSLVKTCN